MSSADLAHLPLILGYWVHDLSPVLIEFTDRIAIRYYGLAYVLGFALAWAVFTWAARKGRSPLKEGELETLFTYLFMGVVVGGRLGYVFLYQTDSLWRDPLYVFRMWEGGMASHGGFVGVIVAVLLFARKHRHDAFLLGDLMAIATPAGLLLGRVANFINGELWGKVTDVPWAVIFPAAQDRPYFRPEAFSVYSETFGRFVNPRHPSQLYEAALEGLVLGIYLHIRFWRGSPASRPPGQIAGEFFVAYGLLRVVGELFREPDADLLLGVSRGIFYSLFTVLGGVGLIWAARRRAAVRIPVTASK